MIATRSSLSKHALLLSYALVAIGCTAVDAKAATPMAADLVMTGGQIYTPNGWVRALAIRHGILIAVGSDAAVAAYRGPATQTSAGGN